MSDIHGIASTKRILRQGIHKFNHLSPVFEEFGPQHLTSVADGKLMDLWALDVIDRFFYNATELERGLHFLILRLPVHKNLLYTMRLYLEGAATYKDVTQARSHIPLATTKYSPSTLCHRISVTDDILRHRAVANGILYCYREANMYPREKAWNESRWIYLASLWLIYGEDTCRRVRLREGLPLLIQEPRVGT